MKRYAIASYFDIDGHGEPYEHPDGDWVRFADYQGVCRDADKAEKERDRLKRDVEALTAERDRLRAKLASEREEVKRLNAFIDSCCGPSKKALAEVDRYRAALARIAQEGTHRRFVENTENPWAFVEFARAALKGEP